MHAAVASRRRRWRCSPHRRQAPRLSPAAPRPGAGHHGRRPFAAQPAAATAGGLSVFVGYAEDKEINTPEPGGVPGAVGRVAQHHLPGRNRSRPGRMRHAHGLLRRRRDQAGQPGDDTDHGVQACRSTCIRRSPAASCSATSGAPSRSHAGQSVILAANPPANNPGYDNFDTSGYPVNNCTPITVAPTVTITVGGVATTLADSTPCARHRRHRSGYCPPKHNESIQWRPIGSAGTGVAHPEPRPRHGHCGHRASRSPRPRPCLTAAGVGLPNAVVNFTVTSGPDARPVRQCGDRLERAGGLLRARCRGRRRRGRGERHHGRHHDVQPVPGDVDGRLGRELELHRHRRTRRWPEASRYDPGTGTWTVSGGGTGLGGTSDQFHFAWQTAPTDGGIAAHVIGQTASGSSALAGVMLRGSTDPGAPYYAALTTPGGNITIPDRTVQGGSTATVASVPGSAPGYLWVAEQRYDPYRVSSRRTAMTGCRCPAPR